MNPCLSTGKSCITLTIRRCDFCSIAVSIYVQAVNQQYQSRSKRVSQSRVHHYIAGSDRTHRQNVIAEANRELCSDRMRRILSSGEAIALQSQTICCSVDHRRTGRGMKSEQEKLLTVNRSNRLLRSLEPSMLVSFTERSVWLNVLKSDYDERINFLALGEWKILFCGSATKFVNLQESCHAGYYRLAE